MIGDHGELTAVIQNYLLILLFYDTDLVSEVAWNEMRYGRLLLIRKDVVVADLKGLSLHSRGGSEKKINISVEIAIDALLGIEPKLCEPFLRKSEQYKN
jgi:hypothetical protein